MKTTKADKHFSLYIRLRDADENGVGTCITCGTRKEVKYMDCGHYIKRQHMATRFSEINCHTQCKRCNAFEQGNDAKFRQALVGLYGEQNVNLLEAERHKTVRRSAYEMDVIAKHYKEKAIELAKEKGIELW